MGKAQIGELFFRERALRLPSKLPEKWRILISEKSLRRTITILTCLFILALTVSLLSQLMLSRSSHLAEQNRLSVLHAQATAQSIVAALSSDVANGETVRPMNGDLLAQSLPDDALAEDRVFALVDNFGLVLASVPASSNLTGQKITDVLGPQFITETDLEAQTMRPLALVNGEGDRKSTRLNSSHVLRSRMPSSA